jgi:hypothetical protein
MPKDEEILSPDRGSVLPVTLKKRKFNELAGLQRTAGGLDEAAKPPPGTVPVHLPAVDSGQRLTQALN